MRDIRPQKRRKKNSAKRSGRGDNKERDIELFEVSVDHQRKERTALPRRRAGVSATALSTRGRPAIKQSRRLTGSRVPVANIHVPRTETESRTGAGRASRTKQPSPLSKKAFGQPSSKVRVGVGERKILLVIFGLVIIAGVGAALIFLPKANITLGLKTAPLLVDEQLVIGPTAADSSAVAGVVFYKEIETNGTYAVENKEIVGEKAAGVVEIVNRTIDEQKIVELSRLVTEDGTLFRMQRHAIVPPQSRVTVAVEAAEAGEQSNIKQGRLDFAALDKRSQQLVFAEVVEPLTGGTGREIAIVSEQDLENAKKHAQEQGRVEAEKVIRAELPADWSILEESWIEEITSFTAKAEVGDQIDAVDYEAQVTVRAMSFNEPALQERLRDVLGQRLADDFMLFPGAISYTQTMIDIDWESARIMLDLRVKHTTVPQLSLATLRDKLVGRSAEEAQSYLEGLPGVNKTSLTLWPFWVRSLPRIEKRIELVLEPERQP